MLEPARRLRLSFHSSVPSGAPPSVTFGLMKPEYDKPSMVTRRFWFGVGGGALFVAGLWIFAFTTYNVPKTTSGVDGLLHGPLPLAGLVGIVCGVALEYLLERRGRPK